MVMPEGTGKRIFSCWDWRPLFMFSVGMAAAKAAKPRTTAERENCILKVEVLKIKIL
jgi:hypothetical protein